MELALLICGVIAVALLFWFVRTLGDVLVELRRIRAVLSLQLRIDASRAEEEEIAFVGVDDKLQAALRNEMKLPDLGTGGES